jgi:hypothetical protein
MDRDFESALIRKGVGAMRTARHVCSRCRRTPLTGERLHRFESGRELCDLCLAALPPGQGEPVASERVHASERPLFAQPAT